MEVTQVKSTTAHLAKHIRELHFGGNWTASNLTENLEGVTWQQATTRVYSFNTIAILVYHMNYYVSAVIKVLQGGPLVAKDSLSFDVPEISSEEDWQSLLDKTWREARTFADLVEQLPDHVLGEDFTDKKYGDYYRNIQGIIEHTHYHLGQVVLIKKIIQAARY